ncbi:MAG: glycosyltransferase [Parcubacteria group bacterium]|nr:glycosyltransferase [Parcubacteria group bacterium]
MRILFGIEAYYPNVSGVVIFTERAAHYVTSRGHEAIIVTTNPGNLPSEAKDPVGVSIYRLPGIQNPFRKQLRISSPTNARKVYELLKNQKPDLVHLQDIGVLNQLILLFSRRLGIPVIAHHHFSMEFVLGYFKRWRFLKPLIRLFVGMRVRKFYGKCKAVLTPTEFSKNTLLQWGVRRTPITAISNGVDLTRFKPDSSKQKGEIVLYVGRMDTDKNLEALYKAIPHILAKMPDVRFLFVGDGTDRAWLEKEVSQQSWKNRVEFIGFVPHEDARFVGLYQSSSLIWTASTIETQSITTLEGLACGLPAVVARAGALPELVHEGENGFLVDPHNPKGFAEAVVKILQSHELVERFSLESVKIASGHAVEKSLQQLETIYREIVSP